MYHTLFGGLFVVSFKVSLDFLARVIVSSLLALDFVVFFPVVVVFVAVCSQASNSLNAFSSTCNLNKQINATTTTTCLHTYTAVPSFSV